MTPQQTAEACVAHMLRSDAASQSMGIAVVAVKPGQATIQLAVTPAMTNGFDICHGGVIFTFGDSAIAFAANTYNEVAVLAAASIDLVRSVAIGTILTATATEQHRGQRSALYDVRITDSRDVTIALMRGRCSRLGRPLLPVSAP
ncbi:MAG: hotdog fold thioesterase [Gammaproteobacteria bacterium]|nr:hotdog fold thioesterase [Gammaproteobacteria bacterium]